MLRPRRQRTTSIENNSNKISRDLDKKRIKSKKINSNEASPLNKKSKKSKIKITILNESDDELYNKFKEIEKLKKKESKTRLKAVKNVKYSTPTQKRAGRKKQTEIKNDLFLELSPIRRSVSNAEISHADYQSITDSFNRRKTVDVESSNREASHIRELKELIIEFQMKRELSALNVNESPPKALQKQQTQQPSLQDIENVKENVIPNRSNSENSIVVEPLKYKKKSVHFNALPQQQKMQANYDQLVLKPGKWRKSLIAWRKSHNQVGNRRKSTRFVKLFPIKTDPNVIKRYTQRFEETLADGTLLLEKSDEGRLQSTLSILDSSVECASFHEPTTFVQHPQRKRETSVIKRTSIFYGLQSPLIHEIDVVSNLSARQILLRRCGQQEPLIFDDIYSHSQLPNCKKIGEGVYGEVFSYSADDDSTIVLKIIPIEGDLIVNGEQQKRFDEILSEVVISMELSGLRNGKENVTDGFVNVKRVTCVKGTYPQHLIEEWEIFNDSHLKGSENDHPEIFGEDQHYIVFELCNAGIDLEAFQFKQAEEALSVFLQVALTLAVAERKFEFEHRDLHWGNILVARTTCKFAEYRVDGKVIQIPTHGVKATIIDYTLSRMIYDDAVLYNNLADDEELFSADGDYQFDIYRFMRDRLDNDFKRFEPFTNLLWLHYLIDKLIDGARYRYSKSEKHKSAINKMMKLRDDLLVDYQSASDYVESLQN